MPERAWIAGRASFRDVKTNFACIPAADISC